MNNVSISSTPSKGEGVYANRDTLLGQLVIRGTIIEELEENNVHACQIGVSRFVTLNEEFRLLNHSCDPNCGICVNKTGAHDLIARRNIEKGEEITFDYAMQNYVISHFPGACLCGATDCRGQVTGWKNLSAGQKKSYREWAAPYLFELDAAEGG